MQEKQDVTETVLGADMVHRCGWCGDDALYVSYHDRDWGVPLYDDRKIFEMLTLEGAQAGLSWLTILRKRDSYRRAFRGFDIPAVATLADDDLEHLRHDEGIVRNRLKIASVRTNAQAALRVIEQYGSLAAYLWCFVDFQPIGNQWQESGEVPNQTPVAQAMSKDLKKKGFTFVGPTICYAFMQSVGMVNDHLVSCFRHQEIAEFNRKHTYPHGK